MRFRLLLSLALMTALQTPSQGILPDITKEQLLEAVQSADQLLQNYQASYDIEETFMPNFDRKYPVPTQRHLSMRYTKKDEKYFYDIDVTFPEDEWNEFPEWSYQDAFNGQIRTQFNPVSQAVNPTRFSSPRFKRVKNSLESLY